MDSKRCISGLALGMALTYVGPIGYGQSTRLELKITTPHGVRVLRGGAGAAPIANPRSEGTVVVAIALSEGLVLAADSRLTIQFTQTSPNYKIASDNTNKVFSVENFAIATFGEMFLDGRSLAAHVAEFHFKLVKDSKRDIDQFSKEFADYIGAVYDRHGAATNNSKPIVGFILEGYDSNGTGKIVEISLPSVRTPVLCYNTRDNHGALWRGHTDVISRLVKGWDSRIVTLPALAGLTEDAKKGFAAQLQGLEYFIPWQYLMLQDGIDLALSLVRTTADMQRFAFGITAAPGDLPSVGGRVDALAITPSGLVWVNRKTLTGQ